MDTLLEHNCYHGMKMAEKEDQCSLDTDQIGGGIRKVNYQITLARCTVRK